MIVAKMKVINSWFDKVFIKPSEQYTNGNAGNL